jgi:hypothetical protein
MVVEAIYLGLVIGNLVLITAFGFQVLTLSIQPFPAFQLSAFPISAFQQGPHPPPRVTTAMVAVLMRGLALLAACVFLPVFHP